MATYSRHSTHHAAPKALPMTMPSKAPAYDYLSSRVAISPPQYSDTTSSSGRHSSRSHSVRSPSSYAPSHASVSDDYHSYRDPGIDVSEMLSERMDRAFDPIRMDKSIVRQAQDSGRLNAKERELQELQQMARRRLKTARVNFDQSVKDAREIREDLDYCRRKTDSIKETTSRRHPEAYAKAKSRSRHAS